VTIVKRDQGARRMAGKILLIEEKFPEESR
jgi:hypothetical protein